MSGQHPPVQLGYITTAGDEAVLPIAANAHLLTQAAEYRHYTRVLRNSAIWDVFWGLVALGAGLVLLRLSIGLSLGLATLGGVVTVAGALLLGVSTWNLAAPSPAGMIADGVLMILLSLLNIGWFISDLMAPDESGHPSYWWLVAFVLTLAGGIHRLCNYGRFKIAAQTIPASATLRWLGEVRTFLKRATPESLPTLIRLDSTNAFPPLSAKVDLLPELAVCLVNNDRLRFVTRDQLSIKPIDDINSGKKKLKAEFAFADKSFKGLIAPSHIGRYETWKSAPDTGGDQVILQET